ncbi:MAG: phosphotransferase [Clostridia bacterium]|nr:phosphotransferase [Clostridia bacterium]
MRTEIKNNVLYCYPAGAVDSSNAKEFEAGILDAMRVHPGCDTVLDMGGMTHISSAGLRVLLRITQEKGAPLILQNVSQDLYEILDVTGFTQLLDVRRSIREISVEGCDFVGRGALGKVYRIDRDTIVKVFENTDALDMIRTEQKRAKQAFLMGIPTAISYDIVRVGQKYGSVFEMVKASTFNDLIVAHPERADELIRRYAGVIHRVHSTLAKPGDLPDAREMYIGFLDKVKDVLKPETERRLRELILAVPEDLHVVHGDFHMKNVMLSDGEPMLIDMETLCAGNPVFDYAGLFVAYEAFNEDDPQNSMNFMGISDELCLAIWRGSLALDLGITDEEALRPIIDRVKVAGYVRFLYLLLILRNGGEELLQTRVRHTLEHLDELLGHVDSLAI